MIQLQSKVKIIDNAGASVGRCLRVLNPHSRKYASVGDIVLVSIIEVAKKSKSSNQPKGSLTQGGGPKGGFAPAPQKGGSKDKKSGADSSTRSGKAGSPTTSPKGGARNFKMKGTMSKALVVRVKSCPTYKNMASFPDGNAVILIKTGSTNSKKNLGLTPVGSRIKGPISNILKLSPASPIYPTL